MKDIPMTKKNTYDVFAIVHLLAEPGMLALLAGVQAVCDHKPLLAHRDADIKVPRPLGSLGVLAAAKLWADLELPTDIRERLNLPLLDGEGILVLRGVSEAKLATVGRALDRILRSAGRGGPLHLLRVGDYAPIALALPTKGPRDGHREEIQCMAFSPKGDLLVTASRDRQGLIWNVEKRATVASFQVSPRVSWLDLSPTGEHAAVFSFDIQLHPLAGGEPWTLRGREALVWSQDGRLVAMVNHEVDASYWGQLEGMRALRQDHSHDRVEVWSLADRKRVLSIAGSSVAFLSNEEIVISDPPAIDETPSDVVRIVRIADGTARLQLSGQLPVVYPNRRCLLTHGPGGCARSYDAATGKLISTFEVYAHAWWREPGTISPDGRRVVFAEDGKAAVFDAGSGLKLYPLSIWHPAFSPDGLSLGGITDLEDSEVAIFAAATGERRFQQRGNEFAFAPDGKTLVVSRRTFSWTTGEPTIAQPPAAALCRVTDGVRVGEIAGEKPVYSKQGDVIATVFQDGQAALWRASDAELLGYLGAVRVLVREISVPKGAAPPAQLKEQRPRVARYVDASYPAVAVPESPFAITVSLRIDAPQPNAAARELLPTHDAQGKPTGAPPVQVRLRASKAFEILGESLFSIDVPEKGEAPSVEFKLQPRAHTHGPQEVLLVFAQVPEVLGNLRLVIDVRSVTATAQVVTATFRSEPRQDAPAAPAPDAVITVTRTRCAGNDTLSYSYEWRARQWRTVDAGAVELQRSASEWASDQYAKMGVFARAEGSQQANAAALAQIGENIYRDLVPPALGEFFLEFLPTGGSLLIYTNEPWLPWEIVKPWHAELDPKYSDFLCARVELARWCFSPAGHMPAGRLSPRQLAPVLSIGDLVAVFDEWCYLESLPATWPPLQVVTPLAGSTKVLHLLEEGQAGILHFATHGLPQSDGRRVATMRVGADELTVDELVGSRLARGIGASAPLVFMNACHSARRDVGLTQTDGWADRFLELGSGAFLGASWEVEDHLARDFACTFYEELKSGSTLAHAVLRARQSIREAAPGNSTWLAYSLYSHPNARVKVPHGD